MARRKRASAESSRLKVLAAAGDDAFAEYALEALASGDRMAREAALEALLERPLPAARPALRELYFELDADGLKRDQGGVMRVSIVRILREIDDSRDADIALQASETVEVAFGEDITWALRAHGLRLLVDAAPDVFPFYAVEHLDDRAGAGGEPANTAFQLLAGTEHYVPLYQWLTSGDRDPQIVAGVFELLGGAPRVVVERYARQAAAVAARRGNDALVTVLAEAIVNLEMEDAYGALGELMSSKLSDELYNYLAVLLAGTARPRLLAILEEQLHRGRRPRVVAEALRIRPTPASEEILRRWEDGE